MSQLKDSDSRAYELIMARARIEYLEKQLATHTNQLIDKILSELPTSNCQRHWADDKGKDCTCDLISRDQVTAILEKKKGI